MTNSTGRVVRELAVPSEPGIHRVNWDLRNSTSSDTETWRSHDDPRLSRPVDDLGPWASPGRFTITVEARGVTSSQTLEVRGDPEMPITQAMYEEREAFLLDLIDLARHIQEARPGLTCEEFRFGRGGQRTEGADGEFCAIQRGADQLSRALTGNEVRPGSLYPPTPEHQARKSALEARLARTLDSM